MKSPWLKAKAAKEHKKSRVFLLFGASAVMCYMIFMAPRTQGQARPPNTKKVVQAIVQTSEKSQVPPLDHEELRPEQSPPDYALWTKYVSNATAYLEWGSGGSTYQAVKLGVPYVFTIENVLDWKKKVEERVALIKKPNQEVTIYAPPMPPVNERGYPISSTEERDSWINYPNALKESPKEPDVVLVDGRFRVACALTALLNLKPETIILIHDFWTRPNYHVILSFVKILERSSDTAIAFQAAPNFDRAKAEEHLQFFRYQGQ